MSENDATLGDLSERLERADALFAKGNLTGAAALARAVEDELEMQRKRSAVGSAERRECTQMLKRARATLERFETEAAIDEDEDEADEDE